MDPDATLKILLDVSLPLDERAEAALNLLVWLANGGAEPVHTNLTRLGVVEQCKIELVKVLDIMPGGTARMMGL